MSLEDQTVDEGRRWFVRASLAAPVAYALRPLDVFGAQDAPKQNTQSEELPVLKKRRITFEQVVEQLKKDPKGDKVGKYDQLKAQYLDQVLVDEFKLVYDKKRNPDGIIKEWFYWQDAKQKKRAIEHIKDDLRKEGKEAKSDERLMAIEMSLPPSRIIHRYSRPYGQKQKSGYLLIDDTVFNLAHEHELFSEMDYFFQLSSGCECNIKVNGQELNPQNRVLYAYNSALIGYEARHAQVMKILKGLRKFVSPEFKSAVLERYLDRYTVIQKFLKESKEDTSDAGQEAYASMQIICTNANNNMKAIGYEHRFDEKENTYELVKISEKK